MVTNECKSKDDVERTTALLNDKLNKDYHVEIQTVKSPRLKIVDVDNNMNMDNLAEDIKNRNSYMLNGDFSIISDYKNTMNQRIVVLEVSANIYSIIVNNGYKIYVGYQCCRMTDVFNLNLCFKCGRLNHSGKNCKNETKCLKCSGNHLTKNCDSEVLKCVNCAFYNCKFNQNRCTDHYPNDTNKCDYLKFRINKLLNTFDYPTSPRVPRYLGIVPGQKKTPLPINP